MSRVNAESPAARRTLLLCAAAAVGVTLAYTLASLIVRPTMYSDSGWGFLGWDAGTGLPLNYVAYVDPADIARDGIGFPTWWSPGQYVVPGLLEMMGLDLGRAMTVTSALSSLLGLAGWFVLYRSFNFPVVTSAVAVALVAFTRHFALPFGNYNGGEVLMFGAAPWFLVLVWRLRAFRLPAVVPLLAGIAAMVFAKLTGLVVAGCAIGAAVLAPPGSWFGRDRIRRGLVAGATLALSGVIFHVVWFSRGGTPVSDLTTFSWWSVVEYAVFVIGAVWGASLSLGELATYVLLHPGRPVLDSVMPIYWAFLPVALATFVFVGRRLHRGHADYLRFVLFMALAMGVVLTVVSARGSPIGMSERHMRIVSLVLFAGIVHAVLAVGWRWLQGLFAAVVVVAGAYGVAAAAAHAAGNLERPIGVRGFRHAIADAGVLEFIRRADVAAPDPRSALIVVTSPEIALEVRNVRVISNHADFETPEQLAATRYRGRVPKLYVIVQERLVANGKADIILRSFVDYRRDEWRQAPLGGFVAFSAEP